MTVKFYSSPEEAYADTDEVEAAGDTGGAVRFYSSPEEAYADTGAPVPVAASELIPTRSSEQAGIVRRQPAPAPTGPGVLETTRAQISGMPMAEQPSLPVNIGAAMIANAPVELGAAGAAARGAAAFSRYGAPAGFWGGVLSGGLGALVGAVAQDRFKEGQQTGQPFGLVPSFGGFDPQAGVSNALWTVLGGQGAPLVQRALGGMWDRLIGRTPATPERLPRDLTPEQRAAARERADLSEEFNVPYTVGELMGDYDLMAREATMPALPGSAQHMNPYLERRAVRLQEEAQNIAGGFSSVPPPQAYAAAGQAARQSIKGLKRKRSVATTPMYQKVWDQNIRVPVRDILKGLADASIEEEEGIKKVLDTTARNIEKAMAKDGTVSARLLHNIQRRRTAQAEKLDDDDVLQATNRNIGRLIKQRLEDLSPDYRAASARYSELSQPIELVRTATRLGRASKKDPVDVGREVASWFHGENAMQSADLANIKQVWRQTLPADQYRITMDGLRAAYLTDAVNRIRPTQGGGPLNVGGKLAQALGGDPSDAGGLYTRQLLEELYTAPQLAKLDRFARLLDDVSTITSFGSATQPRQLARQMRAAREGGIVEDIPTGRQQLQQSGLTGLALDKGYDWARNYMRRRFGIEAREMAANEAYALMLNQGANASVRHLDRLDRALQQMSSRPERAEREITRALGAILGSGFGAELERRQREPAAFVGGS